MKYESAGTYTLVYTATDDCGNTTTENRTIVVSEPVKKTVLFSDGTLIINELDSDRSSNITAHGAVTHEYAPLTATNTYDFSGTSERPWQNMMMSILALEFGSEVAPISIAYWLQNCKNVASIDWTNFSGENCISARAFAAGTAITSFTLPEMPNLETIRFICNDCPNLATVDMSAVNSTSITDINGAFQACYLLEEVDISGLSGTVSACSNAFSNASGGSDMALTTIYANANLDCSQAAAKQNTFRACVDLVGGNGTTYSAAYIDGDYARIDTASAPGYFTQK